MKKNLTNLMMSIGLMGSALAQNTVTGPSSSQSPYFQPSATGYTVTSILTTTDIIGGYKMCGIPDGLGVYDNGNGTFTLLMNHEIQLPAGVNRAHGSNGAFVSKWVINKSNLQVLSGSDLMHNTKLWTGTTYTTYNSTNSSTLAAFSRFCSADLPAVSAYYNSVTGKGTQERIFMNGEESGNEGRLMGHIATGPNAGTSYELPYLGKFSCENAVASPFRSDKTIVGAMDDTSPLGQVYFYIGTKTTTGSEIDKAGLSGGNLYGVGVTGLLNEATATFPAANTTFSLINLPQANAITGTSLNAMSNNLGVTNFLRPEDGAWDPSNPTDFYFNTTDAFNSPSRLWRLRFSDINNPELGGTITAVLDGTEGQNMLDNMAIDNSGHILLCEDVGNNAWNGRILEYNIATDVLTPIGQHDPTRFISGGANFLTQDEETSGIIDAQSVLGPGMFLFTTQAHFAITGEAVEGGQVMAMYNPNTFNNNPEINVQGNAVTIPAGNNAISAGNNTDFGLSNIGVAKTQTFVIQNSGPGALKVIGMSITGASAADFVILNPPTFPLSIPINGTQTFSVKLTPSLVGTRAATINIFNSDYNESIYDFAVQGVGAVPEINLVGNNITILDGNTVATISDNTDFGAVVYNTPVIKTFNIQNIGTGTLTLSGITLTGLNVSAFTLVNPPAFPLNIIGSGSQTFAVKFLATTPNGLNVATVTINNTDSDESVYDFVIKGNSLTDVGINTISKSASFVNLYPNPAKDEATLKLSLENDSFVSITVFDLQGKVAMNAIQKEMEKGDAEIILNTSSLKTGEYFVQINSGNKTDKIKMVVMH